MVDAESSNLAVVENTSELASSQLVERLPFGFAKRHGIVMLDDTQSPVLVGIQATTSNDAIVEARRFINQDIQLKQITDDEFASALGSVYQNDSSEAMQAMEDIGEEMDLFRLAEELPETEDLLENEDDAPIIKLINALLTEAIKEHASDIHIETFEKELTVRFRIDGVLREVLSPKRKLAPLLVSRIKV
ncbi:MAG: ATPase, T2SS/T4P/T4SS family, partial [Kangiellaceae bacterium]|nr:ATPase, T2SS/T4P/T4SS family [Kangiellaceae bacterium]